jgi:hypothetical protein
MTGQKKDYGQGLYPTTPYLIAETLGTVLPKKIAYMNLTRLRVSMSKVQ